MLVQWLVQAVANRWIGVRFPYAAQMKDISPGFIGNKAKTVDKGVYYVYKGQIF